MKELVTRGVFVSEGIGSLFVDSIMSFMLYPLYTGVALLVYTFLYIQYPWSVHMMFN